MLVREAHRVMEILTHPNPVLRQVADEVDPTTDLELRDLVKRMARLMYDAPGVGLAAPQIGVQKRVVVIDVDNGLLALCNPRIVEKSDETAVEEEGCLSVPGIAVPVERPTAVTCEAYDLNGDPIRVEGTDLLARALQHETDHLDGILILDRATPDERRAAIRRYNDIAATF